MAERPSEGPVPGIAAVRDLLRTCIQCGLCLPHCATWLGTGSEVQSPRGRLLLLDRWYRGTGPADPAPFLEAFDQCIGCRACETACPSGVPFSLLERGRDLAAGAPPPGVRPAVPGILLRRMDSPDTLRILARLGTLGRAFCRAFAGRRWRRRLSRGPLGVGAVTRLLGSMPRSPGKDEELRRLLETLGVRVPGPIPPPVTVAGPAVVFFRGCANQGFLSGTTRRLRELLVAAGCRVVDPDDLDCCGALAAHTGRPGRAARLAGANERAFRSHLRGEAVLVAEASGCGHQLKGHPVLGARTRDAVEFLAGGRLPPLGPVPLKVALHDPCHARHGQGLVAEPRALLNRIPDLEILEPGEAEVCCGSGGAWGMRYPELSTELGRRKAALLAATGADLIVTANPGCLGQIADGLAFLEDPPPILPVTDLVWAAACVAGG